MEQQKEKYVLGLLTATTSSTGNDSTDATATLVLMINGNPFKTAELGNGAVDATLTAIRKLADVNAKVTEYNVAAITGGTNAPGEVSMKVQLGEVIADGHGVSPCIIRASALAFIQALNILMRDK